MASAKTWKILRRLAIVLLVAPILVWVGLSLALKLTVLDDAPIGDAFSLVGQGLLETVRCSVIGCEAVLQEGMESVVFDEVLLEGTPVAFDVDEVGRVLVAETGRQNLGAEDNRSHDYWLLDDLASRTVDDRRAYYRKWIEAGRFENPDHFTLESDRIVVLEDADGDGVAESRRVLAEWNEMASGLVAGVESREGTIWATSIPSVYRIEDAERDGVAESVDALATGFGVKTSLIGHDLHGLAWGPDGKLYFSMGDRGYHVTLPDGRVLEPKLGPGRGAVFRMNPDGSGLEVFATGVRNPQELAFDDYGNLFTGDNNGDGGDAARVVYLVEGGETGWAMAYQSLAGDYVRGPWVAERLWDLQHASQPAWVLPPVAHIGNGPAGFVHYPGLGLPERYANHFFLCDYAYMNGRSGIWSFALEPRGAGFEMVDRHKFVWSLLATDFDFSWDGRMFATIFDQIALRQKIASFTHSASQADPRIAELARLALGAMRERSIDELLALLEFADQRIRLRAQYELASRRAIDELVVVARDEQRALVPRLHAVWGLGQIGADGLRSLLPDGGDWAGSAPAELRAQLARVAGDAGASWLAEDLRGWLADEQPRVRFFAAQALGALGDRASVPALIGLLRENADRDVFLRHAVVWALHRIGDPDALFAERADRDRSVRLGVLLGLRHAGDPRVAHFLTDPDELLVVEAARAIYDGPIEPAMPELAALASRLAPAAESDLQTAQALHRRVIGANVRLRSLAGARALAAYVRDESQLESLRRLALDALGQYTTPPPRDLTMGFYRPQAAAAPTILAAVFEEQGRELIVGSLGARALEIASRIGVLTLADAELLALVRDASAGVDEQVSALSALTARSAQDDASDEARAAVMVALASPDPVVRRAGRELLLEIDAQAGLESLLAVVEGGSTSLERKHGWQRLGGVDDLRARDVITQGLVYWESGQLEDDVAIELLEAAQAQGGSLGARATRLLSPEPGAPGEQLAQRRWALAGGDRAAGRQIFQTTGDCQRCHGGGGHGAGAGPDLAGVAAKGAAHVLESLVVPEAQIAEGFGSVVVTRRDGSTIAGLLIEADDARVVIDSGEAAPVVVAADEISTQTPPTTGMPPMGLALDPRALRDVVAYVMSL